MIILKNKLLLAFMAVLALYFVSADTSLQVIQKHCKAQSKALSEKEMKREDACPEYKKLVNCIAQVNFTVINAFVKVHKPENCEFSDEDIKNLQKYSLASTQAMPTTTEENSPSTRPMMMYTLLVIVLILPALCFF